MKTRVLLMTIAALAAMSCYNENDVFYSCDTATDLWVKSNLHEIQKLDRDGWLSLKQEIQIPVYRAFTKEQRVSFWQEKLCEVQRLDWSVAESAHIKKIEDFIATHTYFFDDKPLTDEEDNELETFFYLWNTMAIEQFNWDEQVGYAIICTGLPLKNKRGDLDFNVSLQKSVEQLTGNWENTPVPDCDCSRRYFFACPSHNPSMECKEIECNWADIGCGLFLLQDCNGKCSML